MVLLPWRIFQSQQQALLLKITTHGAVQFMSWMQYCKEIYMDYPSGNPAHVQEYIFGTHHFIQDQ